VRNNPNHPLRRTAVRAFVGACVTLTSSASNLLALSLLQGEQGWICLLCCNSDILFSVIVMQWITSGDRTGTSRTTPVVGSLQQPQMRADGRRGPVLVLPPRTAPSSTFGISEMSHALVEVSPGPPASTERVDEGEFARSQETITLGIQRRVDIDVVSEKK
jgi:hypothetical protein